MNLGSESKTISTRLDVLSRSLLVNKIINVATMSQNFYDILHNISQLHKPDKASNQMKQIIERIPQGHST